MDVAIKEVSKDHIQKLGKITNVFREKDILYQLEHQFIIKLFDTYMVSIIFSSYDTTFIGPH